jgi:hypothetical protein
MKKVLIAAMLSLSLITPSFAGQPDEKGLFLGYHDEKEVVQPITREETIKQLAKDLASLMYLLESFGKEVQKELDRKRKEDK